VDPREAAFRSTSDPTDIGHVGLACFLWFKGHRVIGKRWKTKSVCTWDFDPKDPKVKEDIAAFFQNEALVDPKEFFPKVTEFKRKMYEDRPQ